MSDSRCCTGGNLPPGCRPADLHHGESQLNDLSSGELWRLLDDSRQTQLYRRFFRREWADLSAMLDEPSNADESIRRHWLAWRNSTLDRMLAAGQIRFCDEMAGRGGWSC